MKIRHPNINADPVEVSERSFEKVWSRKGFVPADQEFPSPQGTAEDSEELTDAPGEPETAPEDNQPTAKPKRRFAGSTDSPERRSE